MMVGQERTQTSSMFTIFLLKSGHKTNYYAQVSPTFYRQIFNIPALLFPFTARCLNLAWPGTCSSVDASLVANYSYW